MSLCRFRNDLSHGVINASAQSLTTAERLREQAKHIARELLAITEQHGYQIPRDTDYWTALAQHARSSSTTS